MKVWIPTLVFLAHVMVGPYVYAQTGNSGRASTGAPNSSITAVSAAEIANRVQYRLYPGGKDEEEIKVQPVLPAPTRYPEGATQMVPSSQEN